MAEFSRSPPEPAVGPIAGMETGNSARSRPLVAPSGAGWSGRARERQAVLARSRCESRRNGSWRDRTRKGSLTA